MVYSAYPGIQKTLENLNSIATVYSLAERGGDGSPRFFMEIGAYEAGHELLMLHEVLYL